MNTRFQLLTIALALLVASVVAEVACRLLLPSPTFEFDDVPVNRLPGLLVAHPTRGYAMAPDFSAGFERGGRRIRLETNSLGLRDAPVGDGAEPRWLAAGDSFTVGFGVSRKEAWPAQAEVHLAKLQPSAARPRIYAGGVSGYSLRQIRIAAMELADELRPQRLLVGVYPGAYWRIRTPYVLLNGRLVTASAARHLLPDGTGGYVFSGYEHPLMRNLHVHLGCRSHFAYYLLHTPHSLAGRRGDRPRRGEPDLERTARRLEPLLAELDALAAAARRRALPLPVVLINPQSGDGSFAAKEWAFNQLVGDHLRSLDVPFVDPLEDLQQVAGGRPVLRFPDDHHWTPLAHAVVGRAIAEAVAGEEPTP